MKLPLLERRGPLGIPYALLILLGFFFLLPFGFRGARQSLNKKENDVKDWLPSDFRETAELNWFADHFVGESFVVATWPGCSSDDDRLRLFEEKIRHESEQFDPRGVVSDSLVDSYLRARETGKKYELLRTGNNDHRNWGGQQEKWLKSAKDGVWHYITPDGRLFRWEVTEGPLYSGFREYSKSRGNFKLDGQFVAAFGPESTEEFVNPFYNDPSLLCAPLFEKVETGATIVEQLACEQGPLWPIDLTDADKRKLVAERLAMKRFTGSLFAPAVPNGFTWNPDEFTAAIPEKRRGDLPEDFEFLVSEKLTEIIDDQFDGYTENLAGASTETQTEVWYAIYDYADVEPPPRPTCVLVTLTDLAKENLPYALGRGVLGSPRGRLLELAEQSGIQAAPAPSIAPPPFDAEPVVAAGLPPLRLGGPPVDNVAIDEEGTITLVRLVGYSIVIGFVLSFLCFGSFKIAIMVFIVGGSSAMLSMAVVWWTDGQVDAILMSMPSLVYVLGLSGAIHVINYYRDEVRARGASGAPGRALRHAFLPCTLASVTTAIGLVSLFTSNLAPISNFGLYSAIGVLTTLAILFSYLPAALETFRPTLNIEKTKTGSGDVPPPKESFLSDCWAAVGRWITKRHGIVATACLLVLAVTTFGLTKIQTSVQLLKLFDPDARIIEDYAWLESNFGKLVPMELVVRVPPTIQAEKLDDASAEVQPTLNVLQRAEMISRVGKVVHRALGEPGKGTVGQTTSVETFLKPLPAPKNSYDWRRNEFNDEMLAAHADLISTDYLRVEEDGPYQGSELWRISLRVGALSDVDYGLFISTLGDTVEPVMRAYDVRDELLTQLMTDADGKRTPLSGKDRVLVVGSKRPARLSTIDVVQGEDHDIISENIFLGTFRELLAGEKINGKVAWLDANEASAKLEPGSEGWNKVLAKFDAVVWFAGDGLTKEHFASAQRLVDAHNVIEQEPIAALVDGKIPEVQGVGNLQAIYTGVVPVVYKAQRTLLTSLAHSIGLAFVLIACVMIALLNPGRFPGRAFRPSNMGNAVAAGMVSMIPNVFPVLLVFGVMCHMGIKIDIGTMMTASVAMGVAVDDTIHFLSWFRANLDRGLSRVEAVIETYRRVGPAMTQTTIVGGLGLFVFALSTFTPTQRFGTLMLVMLSAALVGDLILLPALLAGPAGRFFKPRPHLANRHHDDARTESKLDGDQETSSDETSKPAELHEEDEEAIPQLRLHLPAERSRSRKLK